MTVLPRFLLEREDLIAVDKPIGALAVPSRLGVADPRPCVLHQLTSHFQAQLWPVHRLDEEVSGILVLARTAADHRRLCRRFEERMVRKEYEAWTEAPSAAPPLGDETTWESRLVRGKRRAFVAPHGKPALTVASAEGWLRFRGQSVVRWRLEPRTGRGHQLRVHLRDHAAPIVGDQLYGGRLPFVDGGIALRAVRLVIDEATVITAPPLASLVDPSLLEEGAATSHGRAER